VVPRTPYYRHLTPRISEAPLNSCHCRDSNKSSDQHFLGAPART
jgi:hypothetical protein